MPTKQKTPCTRYQHTWEYIKPEQPYYPSTREEETVLADLVCMKCGIKATEVWRIKGRRLENGERELMF